MRCELAIFSLGRRRRGDHAGSGCFTIRSLATNDPSISRSIACTRYKARGSLFLRLCARLFLVRVGFRPSHHLTQPAATACEPSACGRGSGHSILLFTCHLLTDNRKLQQNRLIYNISLYIKM